MTSQVLEESRLETGDDADDVNHYFCCCSPEMGLCGVVFDEDEPVGPDDRVPVCESCKDMADARCILCGYDMYGPCFCGRCG